MSLLHNHKHHNTEKKDNKKENKSEKAILRAFIINFTFTIIEFIGGILTNSIAILSDALHDLGDSISLGMAYFLEKISRKKHRRFSYGLKRLSLLSSLILGTILLIGSGIIIKESIERILSPEPIHSLGMIALAILGITINGYGAYITSKGSSFNEKIVTLHLLEDVAGWIAVLFAGIVTYAFNSFYYIDGIISLIFAFFIIYNVLRNSKEVIMIFLQASPKEHSVDDIKNKLLTMKEVLDVHDIHLWSLDGNTNILTLHVLIEEKTESERVKEKIKKKLKTMGIEHSTIEIEYNKCEEKCE